MKQRNPILLAPIFLIAAAIVYLLLVKPAVGRLEACRAERMSLNAKTERMKVDFRSRVAVQNRIRAVEEEIGQHEKDLLEPLLESYAMRAKSIVGDLAVQAGLVDAEFSDRPSRALPVLPGLPVPSVLYARLPVLISCLGDYAAIISFIMRVERDIPQVTLQALRIVPTGTNNDLQHAEIILEWPVKGASK